MRNNSMYCPLRLTILHLYNAKVLHAFNSDVFFIVSTHKCYMYFVSVVRIWKLQISVIFKAMITCRNCTNVTMYSTYLFYTNGPIGVTADKRYAYHPISAKAVYMAGYSHKKNEWIRRIPIRTLHVIQYERHKIEVYGRVVRVNPDHLSLIAYDGF